VSYFDGNFWMWIFGRDRMSAAGTLYRKSRHLAAATFRRKLV
jgi:hypothetical protein